MEKQEWNPGRLLQLSSQYWATCTLHAAVKLDVFTAIGDRQLSSDDIAQKRNVSKEGITRLLNALTAMNLIEKSDDKFFNTRAGKTFLSKDSPKYIGHIITHHHHLVDSWSKLDQAVETGAPVRARVSHTSPEWRESFLMGMFNIGMSMAPLLADKIELFERRHMLDLGGGPGTYAIHFCMKNPQLKATVYDLFTTRPFAEKTIEKFGLTDRIDFMDGNYVEEGIEGVYDVAWLSHILHGEGQKECQRIIEKTVLALEPGGMIIVHDFILNNTMDGPLMPALFSLNMLLGTPVGQSYSEKQITDMLAKAGVKEIQRLSFQGPNDSGIITGVI
ncbi:MAG: SAM-dependent methyltransferase [Desulfobacteraceae bacterium]|uniref:SAM-dependent methyltransferase n=1 Tax=Candidatus Desulfaltia bathyphila TaxID=2841697 RepID=A0A8J6TCI6_9BACT|nr:SAM-dependent methyltransferase [Candidatus Desulfaltia bathyphila]MBL7196021.1 SAM-dependent methyltransferase [Desulfobacterales bacterium]